MRNTFSRTLQSTKAKVTVTVDGTAETNEIIIAGEATRSQIAGEAFERFPNASVKIESLVVESVLYEISLDDFMKYGKPVVKAVK